MKRSEINELIDNAKRLLHKNNITLPPFAYWSPDDWKDKGSECDEIRKCMLGWDITDFGTGKFSEVGLVVFTVRNGSYDIEAYKNKTYCEKILIQGENQHTPMHFHWNKVEDIINKCNGNMVVKLYNANKDEMLAETDVEVSLDGVRKIVPAGAELILKPGESITIPSFLYHEFWGEEGKGTVILGEVSKVNDDNADNRFFKPLGRFPEIEEDCEPIHYLCNEYSA
jgi:D-lyxose ketol-isomerase